MGPAPAHVAPRLFAPHLDLALAECATYIYDAISFHVRADSRGVFVYVTVSKLFVK